ncbi:MAG: hypothetical protein JSV52_03760 [Candidatus Zixiibacteriota bacterium]|nr:MAG: hypothetical protein JSV52_03760 [candidate division Zixibacteria bacterium]
MFNRLKGLIAVSALLLTVIPTYAEVVPEVSFSGGYTDNLFNDSSSIDDGYTAVSPNLKIYPSATTEIALSGSYTSYFDNSDLSSIYGTAAITFIPSLKESKLNVLLSADIAGRSYGELYEPYSYWGADVNALFNYRLVSGIIIRGGASAGTTKFPNSILGASEGIGCFGGLNFTPVGSNSVNLEAGLSLQRYVTGLDSVETGGPRHPSYIVEGEKSSFHVAYFEARYSRPFGIRTGVNALITSRWIVEEPDSTLDGFSVDYLSPWSSLWGGQSFGANIKNFPGGDFIIESGFTLFFKEYSQDYESQKRDDDRVSVYFQVQRPFSTGSGMLIKPMLQLHWVNNSSSVSRYDYSYYDVQFGISLRF